MMGRAQPHDFQRLAVILVVCKCADRSTNATISARYAVFLGAMRRRVSGIETNSDYREAFAQLESVGGSKQAANSYCFQRLLAPVRVTENDAAAIASVFGGKIEEGE